MVKLTKLNLETYAYIDDTFPFTIKRNGVAEDITGWTVYFTVKKNQLDTNALISKTVTTHTNPTSGITTVSIDKEDTQELSGTLYYDLKVLNLSGKLKIYSEGDFKINPGVKRV